MNAGGIMNSGARMNPGGLIVTTPTGREIVMSASSTRRVS